MATEANSQARLGAVLFYGIVALLAYLAFRVFEPFLVPLAWAAVLVVVFDPWHRRLELRWGRTWAAVASTAAVTLILIVPAILVTTAFVRQGLTAARWAEQALAAGHLTWANKAWSWVQQHVPGGHPEDLATLARQAGERLADFLAGELSTVLRNVAGFLFDFVVVLLAMFYLFRDADSVLARLRQALPFEERQRERMIGEARDLIFASVTSSLVAAAVHGIVGGSAFALAGLGAPIFWGVVMAFCSLLPLVGSAIIWAPAAIGLMFNGRPGRGIFVVVVCSVVVGFVDNVVRPWLISGRARLSGLVVFISVLGGIGVFGVLGVILGPIVVATAASVLDIYTMREPPEHSGTKAVRGKVKAVLE